MIFRPAGPQNPHWGDVCARWPDVVMVPRIPADEAVIDSPRAVVEAAKASGGVAVDGWSIRAWPFRLIEAEQYCVLRKRTGLLVDPNPHPRGEERTCFAADLAAEFAPGGRVRLAPIHINVARGQYKTGVDAFLSVRKRRQRLELDSAPDPSANAAERIAALLEEERKLAGALV